MRPDLSGIAVRKIDLTRYAKSRRRGRPRHAGLYPGGLRLLGSAVKSSMIVLVAWRTVDADARITTFRHGRHVAGRDCSHAIWGYIHWSGRKDVQGLAVRYGMMEMMPFDTWSWFCSSRLISRQSPPSCCRAHVIGFWKAGQFCSCGQSR